MLVRQRYLDEEIKKKQMEERLNELSLLDGSAPIDLDKFRELLQQELGNEDSRKAALQGLIEEIVAHPDYTMEVKYRIGKNDPVGTAPTPRVTIGPRRYIQFSSAKRQRSTAFLPVRTPKPNHPSMLA